MHVTVTADGDNLHVTTGDGRAVEGHVVAAGEPMLVDYWGRAAAITPSAGAPADSLAALVGRPVVLGRARRGAVVSGAPVSLSATPSLVYLDEPIGPPWRHGGSARFRNP